MPRPASYRPSTCAPDTPIDGKSRKLTGVPTAVLAGPGGESLASEIGAPGGVETDGDLVNAPRLPRLSGDCGARHGSRRFREIQHTESAREPMDATTQVAPSETPLIFPVAST